MTSKKRVLRELHESELAEKRNQLDAVGKQFTEEAKRKEQVFLKEKVGIDHGQSLKSSTAPLFIFALHCEGEIGERARATPSHQSAV